MQDHSKQEHLNNFIEYLKQNNRSEYTIIAYKKDIEQLLDFIFKKKSKKNIMDIEDKDIKDYFEGLKNTSEYAPKTTSRKLNSTRTFFKYLQTEGIMLSNPSNNVKHPKYATNPPRVLSQTEYMALRDAAKNDVRISSIIEILLQTGIRIGELCRIKLPDVKLENKVPSLNISFYSKNPIRNIPLNESAIKALKAYLAIRPTSKDDTLFITKNGHPLLVRNIRASIDNMFKKAKILNAKVNDLRNTFIAHHISKGTSIHALSKLVGHKRIATTEKYIGMIPVDKEDKIILTEL